MSQLKPQAPKNVTVIVSIVLVLLGFLGGEIAPFFAQNGEVLFLAGFVLLLLGVYIKGL